jgi:hypothetical protein
LPRQFFFSFLQKWAMRARKGDVAMCGGGLQLRVAHTRGVIMARGEMKRSAAQSNCRLLPQPGMVVGQSRAQGCHPLLLEVNCSPLLIRLSFWVELIGACNLIWYQSQRSRV